MTGKKEDVYCTRAPDGPGWAEKKKPMGFFIFYWPGPPWAGPELGSPAHALARDVQPTGAHGLAQIIDFTLMNFLLKFDLDLFIINASNIA